MELRIAAVALLAIGMAGCSTSNGYNSGYRNTAVSSPGTCYDCGVVQRIESYSGERRASGAGAVAGAVVGGAIGNQIGSGDGKTAATVAGAIAGGIAGNAIEKNMDRDWYEITVLMNDGRQLVVTQGGLNNVREGSRVVIRDGAAYLD